MERFEAIFEHHTANRVIRCRSCGFCPDPQCIAQHLQKYHSHISPLIRASIVTVVQSLDNVARQPADVVYPDPHNGPIEGLPVYDNRVWCAASNPQGERCPYVVKDVQTIQEHCKRSHGWINEQKRGGHTRTKKVHTPNRMWTDGVRCQRFFISGAWKRFFVVQHQPGQSDVRQAEQIVERGKKMFEARWQQREERQKEKNIQAHDHRYEANAWLERTGWANHLTMYQPSELADMIALPDKASGAVSRDHDEGDREDEGDLWWACRSTVCVIRQAQKACRQEVVGWPALEYVNRRETGQKSNEKPFYGKQMGKTIVKYSRHFTHILCFVWRTHEDDDPAPPYRLTRQQRRCLAQWQGRIATFRQCRSREHRAEMEEACLAWWMSLIDHQVGDDEYESALISGAAVLGWNPVGGRWKTALNYPPTLSGIIAIARMLVIYHCHRERESAIEERQRAGFDEDDARAKAPTHFQLVQKVVHRCMTLVPWGGRPSPMNFMLRLRTMGMNIRMNHPEEGQIVWNGEEIQCGPVHMTMPQLRGMIHGLVADVRVRLWRDVLLLNVDAHGRVVTGSTPLPPVDWDRLYDDPSEMREGWNFLQDTRNRFPVDGRRWLHDRILQEPALRRRFIDTQARGGHEVDDELRWRRSAMDEHIDHFVDVKRDMMVLTHMCGGGPWRGSEITTVQHCNSSTNMGRSIYISQGMVQITTGYHKGFGISAKPKIIHRFVPREVSELWIYLLWLAQPQIETEQMYRDQQQDFGPWMWEPRPNEGDDIEDGEIDMYGNMDDDVVEEGVPARVDFEEGEDGVPDAGSQPEQGHSDVDATHAVRALNVDGFWDSGRVRYALQRATLKGVGVKIGIMAWRHMVKAIFRRYIENPQVRQMIEDEIPGTPVGFTDMCNRIFGHSSHMAGLVYGKEMTEAPAHTVAEREGYRQVSIAWHRFLQFASAMDTHPGPVAGPAIVAVEPHVRHEQRQRWQRMQTADLRQAYRRLMGDETAEFRGGQQEVLEAIVARQSPVVAIMATGTGKSVLFQLPAAMHPESVTIVVVPLTSLCTNMRGRCITMGIRCVVWNPSHPPDDAQIVLVTPEAATRGDQFHNFVNRLRTLGRLERFVIDEAHVVLDSVRGWREAVRQISEFERHQTQLVYLTATLSPADEATFYHMTGIEPQRVHMFRYATMRRNIAYQVRPYAADEEDEAVLALVEAKKAQYPMPGQIIVYCGSVERTVAMGRVLGCAVYHRQVGTAAQKEALLTQLTEGREQVFTATNALGLGIDRGSIRVVIHVGIPFRMRDFAQESGRAGRDGEASESIIMQPWVTKEHGRRQPARTYGVEGAMESFVKGSECRRVVLDDVMDGRTSRMSCEEGELTCDVCRRRQRGRKRSGPDMVHPRRVCRRVQHAPPESASDEDGDSGFGDGIRLPYAPECTPRPLGETMMTPPPSSEPLDGMSGWDHEDRRQWVASQCRRDQRRDEADAVDELARQLRRWHEQCPLCVVRRQNPTDHPLSQCPQPDAAAVRQASQVRARGMRYEHYAACWNCGMPQEVCHGWEPRRDGGFRRKQAGDACQYRAHFHMDMVVTVSGHGIHDWAPIIDDWVWEESKVRISEMVEDAEEMKWWGEKVIWGGMESSQLIRMFSRCVVLMERTQDWDRPLVDKWVPAA